MGRWSHELMGLCTEVLRLLKVLRLLNASVLQWYLLVSLPRPTMITEPAADFVLSGLSGVVRRLFRKVQYLVFVFNFTLRTNIESLTLEAAPL